MSKSRNDVTFPKSIIDQNKTLLFSHTNSQGYAREVFTTNTGILIEKKLSGDKLPKLSDGFSENGSNQDKKDEFKKSFDDYFAHHRLAILDFEGLFFYHYAQVASSLKAHYVHLMGSECRERTDIDQAFTEFSKTCSQNAEKIFEKCLKEKTNQEGKIDVSGLNKMLNKEIAALKEALDSAFEKKLEQKNITKGTGEFRKITNAFNTHITDITETPIGAGADTFIEKIESSPITAHDKHNGPAISKITMSIRNAQGEAVLHQSYRTSHLVSNPVDKKWLGCSVVAVIGVFVYIGYIIGTCLIASSAISFPPLAIALAAIGVVLLGKIAYDYWKHSKNIEKNTQNTQEIIGKFMDQRGEEKQPIIYNLYTSTHASEISPVGIVDFFDNQQTQRLETLINAQHRHNFSKQNISDMFFTLNTPTNTFGKEISLKEFESEPNMLLVAQSNLIALAILLYGQDNTNVQNMVEAYKEKNNEQFKTVYETLKREQLKTVYETLKREQPNQNGAPKQEKALAFLYQRFLEDNAAHHQYAKTTATCVGVLSRKVNLIEGCKSGNERTGGILGRVATFLSNDIGLGELDQTYNDTRCNSSAVTTVSRCDQGSDPKTGCQGESIWPNTNKTEGKDMTNIQTEGVGPMQAHNDNSFVLGPEAKERIMNQSIFGIGLRH